MIEISFGKLILLALVALIVLGPEKLPGAARTAGALLRRLRSGWDNVRAEVERELEIEEIRRAAREAAAQAEAAQAELDTSLKQLRDPLEQAAAKTNERFQLTDAAPATESPAMVPEGAALSDARPRPDGAETSVLGDSLPRAAAHAAEGSPATARESGGPAGDHRPAASEAHATGQLFEDAPVPTVDAPRVTRNSAHGGH